MKRHPDFHHLGWKNDVLVWVAIIGIILAISGVAHLVGLTHESGDRCERIAKSAHQSNPAITERRFYADCTGAIKATRVQ